MYRYKIDKGIEVGDGGRYGSVIDTVRMMEVGDSVVLDRKGKSAAFRGARRIGRVLTSRTLKSGKVRIWRVAIMLILMCGGCANDMTFEQRRALWAVSQGMQTFGDSLEQNAYRPQSAFTTRTGNTEYTTFGNGRSAFTTHTGQNSYTTW